MAVGETSGQAQPRKVVSSAGASPPGRRRGRRADEAVAEEADAALKEADPELERLLAEEEEIERRTREHHETPALPAGRTD